MKKDRPGLERELIVRNVPRPQANGGTNVVERRGHRLLGQSVHQVDIEILEPGSVQLLSRLISLARRVNASEPLEMLIVEALCPQRNSIDARRTIFREPSAFDGPRICLERDLGPRIEPLVMAYRSEDLADGGRREKARRTPSDEDARPVPTLYPRSL